MLRDNNTGSFRIPDLSSDYFHLFVMVVMRMGYSCGIPIKLINPPWFSSLLFHRDDSEFRNTIHVMFGKRKIVEISCGRFATRVYTREAFASALGSAFREMRPWNGSVPLLWFYYSERSVRRYRGIVFSSILYYILLFRWGTHSEESRRNAWYSLERRLCRFLLGRKRREQITRDSLRASSLGLDILEAGAGVGMT
jgi:hypothetical protein